LRGNPILGSGPAIVEVAGSAGGADLGTGAGVLAERESSFQTKSRTSGPVISGTAASRPTLRSPARIFTATRAAAGFSDL
jgi:hypothetical protein